MDRNLQVIEYQNLKLSVNLQLFDYYLVYKYDTIQKLGLQHCMSYTER